jgi:FkbH-like protein
MVFLDDRADERALVGEAYPDLVVLDPNDPATWELIELWGDMSQGTSEVDRTALYQVQGVRDALLSQDPRDTEANDGAALKKLGLVATISSAQRADLKRIAELVNRTNQWNLCGSRTTFAQVRAWHDEQSTEILIGKVADRFGDMGIVCVAIVFKRARDAEIGVFVLSCRAFGYGIESAMLSEISRRCDIGASRQALIGLHRPNAQNHPCHDMYPQHGFEATDGGYEWKGAPAFRAVPWLQVLAADSA